MKKYLLVLSVFVMAASAVLHAENPLEAQRRHKQEVARENSAALNQKASKAARAEAKNLKKDGWMAAPGALPLEKQLDKCYKLQYQTDAEGYPEYLMAEGMSVGSVYDSAKLAAIEAAKQRLAGQIQSEVASLIKMTEANDQLGGFDAESVSKTTAASQNFIKQSLGRVLVVTEAYRMVGNGRREVLVRIAYTQKQIDRITREAAKKSLEDSGAELHDELKEMLGQ